MKDQKYIDILIEQFASKKHYEKIREVRARKEEYEKTHPDLDIQENIMEAIIQYQGKKIRDYFLTELQPFKGDPERIPDIPVLPVEWLRENVWPGLFRAGAVRKEDLVPGKTYKGSCRNASEATWDGEKFTYTRYKFGNTFTENIKHFQDDDGTDVFIPITDE